MGRGMGTAVMYLTGSWCGSKRRGGVDSKMFQPSSSWDSHAVTESARQRDRLTRRGVSLIGSIQSSTSSLVANGKMRYAARHVNKSYSMTRFMLLVHPS